MVAPAEIPVTFGSCQREPHLTKAIALIAVLTLAIGLGGLAASPASAASAATAASSSPAGSCVTKSGQPSKSKKCQAKAAAASSAPSTAPASGAPAASAAKPALVCAPGERKIFGKCYPPKPAAAPAPAGASSPMSSSPAARAKTTGGAIHCVKGKPCGHACIAQDKVCQIPST